jgi:Purple acid Phosphatase, N-terminal domain
VFALVLALLAAVGAVAEPVKITHGPVVEQTDAHGATIAWSTNSSSATIVHYGTDPNQLDEKAEMPWGALTHRVTLKNLRPGTTYYFKADSSDSEGTGFDAISQVGTFTTTQ